MTTLPIDPNALRQNNTILVKVSTKFYETKAALSSRIFWIFEFIEMAVHAIQGDTIRIPIRSERII